jgi:hypothetical protein
MPTRGIKALFGWIPVVFRTSDAFVLRSAGLDALVLQKSFAVCVQIFVPLCVLSCSVLLPVQSSQQFMAKSATNDRSFASITMANINSRSPVMWLHFLLAVVFIGYSFLLIEWHYRQYVALRQHYLHGGDDPNYWRDLHLAEADGVLSDGGAAGGGGGGGAGGAGGIGGAAQALGAGGARIFDVVAEARYRAVLEALDDQSRERVRQLAPWERALLWMTSWTGTEDAEKARLHRAGEAAKRASMKVGAHFNVARALITGELGSRPSTAGGGAGGGEESSAGSDGTAAADDDGDDGRSPAGQRSASTVLRERLFGRMQNRVPATMVGEESIPRTAGGGLDNGGSQSLRRGRAAAAPPPRAPPPTAGGASSVTAGGGLESIDLEQQHPHARRQSLGQSVPGGGIGGGGNNGTTTTTTTTLSPAAAAAAAADPSDGGDYDPLSRRVTTVADFAQRDIHGEDIGSRAAPKWWSSIDTVTTQDGRLRRLTADEAEALSSGGQAAVMLAKPSVRYRKTINTHLRTGRRVAVNAQQYAVLVTNVPEPCYPEMVEQRRAEARRAVALDKRQREAAARGRAAARGGGGKGDTHADTAPAAEQQQPQQAASSSVVNPLHLLRPLSPVISADGLREDDVHNLPALAAQRSSASRSRRARRHDALAAKAPASSSRSDGIFLGAGWCGYKPGHADASHEAVRSWVKGEEWLARHAAAGGGGYGYADPFDAAELARREEEEEAAAREAEEAAAESGLVVDRETSDLRGALRHAGADPVVREAMHQQQVRDGEANHDDSDYDGNNPLQRHQTPSRRRSVQEGAARGWQAARRAARDGSLKTLARSPQYSLVAAVFSTLFPEDFDRVVPVFNHRAVDMALRAWDRRLGELEAAQHRYRLTGVRPTLVPPGSAKVPLSVLEAAGQTGDAGMAAASAAARLGTTPSGVAAEALMMEEQAAMRAAEEGRGKSGGGGGGGGGSSSSGGGGGESASKHHHPHQKSSNSDRKVPARVDAIDWLAADLKRLEQVVVDERAKALREGFTPSWFVLFRTQKAAAVAASCNIHPLNRAGFQVHPAPGPEEVNWYALWFTHEQRVVRGWIVVPCIVFLVLVPVSLVAAAVTQINAAFCTSSLSWRWYCCSRNWVARGAKSLLTGFVPTLLVLLWQGMAMPRLVFMCAQSEARHYSLSLLDRRMGEIYFLWACFNFFLGGILGGAALFTTNLLRLSETFSAGDAMGVLNSLSAAIPASAKFFVLYMINRTLMTLPLRFLITQPGVWQAWLRLFDVFARPSERQLFLNYAIRSPRYGPEYGNMLLIALIGWAFALVCPVVLPFCTVWFIGMWLFWRYQLIYNYARKYESGGRMWPFFVSRLVSLFLSRGGCANRNFLLAHARSLALSCSRHAPPPPKKNLTLSPPPTKKPSTPTNKQQLICMAVMILLTALVLITKAALAQGVLLVIFGLIALLQFNRRLQTRYAQGIDRMPLLLADAAPKARVPSTCYVPPPMLEGGLAWHPEWNRIWEWFGMPSHSF